MYRSKDDEKNDIELSVANLVYVGKGCFNPLGSRADVYDYYRAIAYKKWLEDKRGKPPDTDALDDLTVCNIDS